MSVYEDHAFLVERTCKDGSEIETTGMQRHYIHMVLGIAGEAGELVDAIKKHVIYNKPLDLENVVEELGDIEWYMEGLRASIGVTREQVLAYNIEKLNKRYPAKYSDNDAQNRADKT